MCGSVGACSIRSCLSWQTLVASLSWRGPKIAPPLKLGDTGRICCACVMLGKTTTGVVMSKQMKMWFAAKRVLPLIAVQVSVYTYNSTVTLRGTESKANRTARQKNVSIAHVGDNHYDALVECGSPSVREVCGPGPTAGACLSP